MNEPILDARVWTAHPDALVLVADGTVVDANPSTEQMYGYHQSWLVGKPTEVLAPLDRLVPDQTSPVFRAWRSDGASFMATASMVESVGEDVPHLVVVRDVSSLVRWLEISAGDDVARWQQLAERERAVDAHRETVTQHLFGAGLELVSCLETGSVPTRERVERAIEVLEEAMKDLADNR